MYIKQYRYDTRGSPSSHDSRWLCTKCNKYISNCIDIDHHINVEHPNFEDKYVKSWYINGKKTLSPYD
jgi:hypothetical protein